MAIGIMGRKLGMTRIFTSDGISVACTVIAAGPCPVVQVKDQATDGYNALQIAFGETVERKLNKPAKGHLAKLGALFKHLREIRLDSVEGYEVGSNITVDIFAAGETVKITGRSKGKGFQGVMKRWNFRGSPASHGHEKVHRSPGSIGCATQPGRVVKGKKMPGHMGDRTVTSIGLEVLDVRPEENILIIKGAIPGAKNGLVMIRKQKG